MHKVGPVTRKRRKGFRAGGSGLARNELVLAWPAEMSLSLLRWSQSSFFPGSVSSSIKWINGVSGGMGSQCGWNVVLEWGWSSLWDPIKILPAPTPGALCQVRWEHRVPPLAVFLNIEAYIPKVGDWEHWAVLEKPPLMVKIHILAVGKDVGLC